MHWLRPLHAIHHLLKNRAKVAGREVNEKLTTLSPIGGAGAQKSVEEPRFFCILQLQRLAWRANIAAIC